MTDQDRGAYTPQTDAPLAFDARLSHGGRSSQAPLTLIVSAVVLGGLVFAMVMFYRGGVRGSGQPPQVVGAPVGEAKAPPPSAQAASPGAALQIYKAEATPAGEPKGPPAFVPPPEETAVRPTAPAVAPVAAAPAQPPAEAAHLRTAQAPSSDEPAASAPVSSVPPKPAVEKLAVEKPVKAAPVKTPPVKTPPAAPVVEASNAAGGLRNLVQIGAFSSPAIAEKGWSDVAALLPGQMEGKTRKVEQTTKDGKIFYRTFVGGFSSKDDADAFCASLKAAGKPCFVK